MTAVNGRQLWLTHTSAAVDAAQLTPNGNDRIHALPLLTVDYTPTAKRVQAFQNSLQPLRPTAGDAHSSPAQNLPQLIFFVSRAAIAGFFSLLQATLLQSDLVPNQSAAPIALKRPRALFFTGAISAAYWQAQLAQSALAALWRDVPCHVAQADEDSLAFFQRVLANDPIVAAATQPQQTTVWLIRAQSGREALADWLTLQGITVRHCATYERGFDDSAFARLQQGMSAAHADCQSCWQQCLYINSSTTLRHTQTIWRSPVALSVARSESIPTANHILLLTHPRIAQQWQALIQPDQRLDEPQSIESRAENRTSRSVENSTNGWSIQLIAPGINALRAWYEAL